MASRLVPAAVFLMLIVAPRSSAQTFEPLGFPPWTGATTSAPTGISHDGRVVVGTPSFWWSGDDGFVEITGTIGAEVWSANGDGSVVVGSTREADGKDIPLTWSIVNGVPSFSTLDTIGVAVDVSSDGTLAAGIARRGHVDRFGREGTVFRATRWNNGVAETLTQFIDVDRDAGARAISADGSTVVGQIDQVSGRNIATVWGPAFSGVIGMLPDGNGSSEALDVSADGSVVVGLSSHAGPGSLPFRWTADSGMVALELPEFYTQGEALTVSGDGTVIGGSLHRRWAFLWTEEDGTRLLTDVLIEAGLEDDIDGWDFVRVDAISQDGKSYVGTAINPDGQTEAFRVSFGSLVVNDLGDLSDADLDDNKCDVDLVSTGDQCTLRAAIQIANREDDGDVIRFDLPGSAPHTIALSANLPNIVHPVDIDATTQPGHNGEPIVVISGSGTGDGFRITGGGSAIRGFVVGGFSGSGIALSGPGGNTVVGCHIGTDAAGAVASANGIGIHIDGSPDNRIGGENLEDMNVISGNSGPGVMLSGAAATRNIIRGNRIGTNRDGDFAVANGQNGVVIDHSPNSRITDNVISGNESAGVDVRGTDAVGVVITGNHIGVNGAGTGALGNLAEGVVVEDAPSVTIGGSTSDDRNVISGNATHGVTVSGSESAGATIQGNYIGLNATGTAALPNGTDDDNETGHMGVLITGVPSATVGGETNSVGSAPGNIISGNAAGGIYISGTLDSDASSNGFSALGNAIGSDASGNGLVANGADAITLDGAVAGAMIGRPGAGNHVVAQDDKNGIVLIDRGDAVGSPNNTGIASNVIGFNRGGSARLGSPAFAIAVLPDADEGGALVNVGGAEAESGNQINAANRGVFLSGAKSRGSIIQHNTFGLLASGQLARSESEDKGFAIQLVIADGVEISDNVIGGWNVGMIIGGNENEIYRNKVGTDPGGTQARPNLVGVFVPSELDNGFATGNRNIIGDSGNGNLISGNTASGIILGGQFNVFGEDSGRIATALQHSGVTKSIPLSGRTQGKRAPGFASGDDNAIAFNTIGTTLSGNRQLGNGRAASFEDARYGIWISGSDNTLVVGNLISGNGIGLVVFNEDYSPEKTTAYANIIGGSRTSGEVVPNQHGGVVISVSNSNVLTAQPLTPNGEPVGNVIAGNGGFGVWTLIADSDDYGNQVRYSSFLKNRGPSIRLWGDESGGYPETAPDPPGVYSAVVTTDGVDLRYNAGVAGDVDLFLSNSCTGGNADGVYSQSQLASGAAQTLTFPVDPSEAFTFLGSFMALTVTPPGVTATTSAFSDCVRITGSEDVVEVDILDNQVDVVIDSVDIRVEITNNPGKSGLAAGTLYAARHHVKPLPGLLEGSAVAPNGATLAPNTVGGGRYWSLRGTEGLANITYSVCLGLLDVDGVQSPEELLVIHRPDPGEPWTLFDSTFDNNRLCAAGLTSLGEIGFAADSAANPVPIDPGPGQDIPRELDVAVFPNPANAVATISIKLPVAATVDVAAFDIMGRAVRRMQSDELGAGTHTIPLDAASLPSGVYFVRVQVGSEAQTQRVVVAR